ncbi:MAG TPA: hypothetical protein VMY39_10535 [Planctomycetota bacterium]|nr:hypothetical protein [Planctomycetota bacterium]
MGLDEFNIMTIKRPDEIEGYERSRPWFTFAVVVDNADPEMRRRARLEIPGEGPTGWIEQLGANLDGQMGNSIVGKSSSPRIGSAVTVWCHMGSPDERFYMLGGPFVCPPDVDNPATSVCEMPRYFSDERNGVTPETAPLIDILEYEDFEIVVDGREDKKTLLIQTKETFDGLPVYDRVTGAQTGTADQVPSARFELNALDRSISLDAIQSIDIHCLVGGIAITSDANALTLNGRTVRRQGGPI